MERNDHGENTYPDWMEESVIFLVILALCCALACGVFQFAQFLGWIPDLWWLR